MRDSIVGQALLTALALSHPYNCGRIIKGMVMIRIDFLHCVWRFGKFWQRTRKEMIPESQHLGVLLAAHGNVLLLD